MIPLEKYAFLGQNDANPSQKAKLLANFDTI